MPQGVVYATEEREGTEEVAREEGLNAHFEEAEDASSGDGGEGVDRLMESEPLEHRLSKITLIWGWGVQN